MLVILAVTLISVTTQAAGPNRGSTPSSAAPIETKELAEYRLRAPVFSQFAQASRLIGSVTREQPRFTYAPLFTKEVAVSGDAPMMASALVARLENDMALSEALQSAGIAPREYATFALALLAAHLAHGFLDAGVLKRVPDGAPAENVAFVDAHQDEIAAVFEDLGIAD